MRRCASSAEALLHCIQRDIFAARMSRFFRSAAFLGGDLPDRAVKPARAIPPVRTGRPPCPANPRCGCGRPDRWRDAAASAPSAAASAAAQIPRWNSRNREQAATRRSMPAVMKALGPSRSYSPHPVSTSPKSNSPDSRQPLACSPSKKFSGMYSPVRITGGACIGINGVARRRKSSRPSRNFRGNPRRVCLARQPSICLRMKFVPARLDRGEIAERDALHFGDGLADLTEHTLLVCSGTPATLPRRARPRGV